MKPKKIADLLKNKIILLPFITILMIMFFVFIIDTVQVNNRIQNVHNDYLNSMKSRMIDEVNVALKITALSVEKMSEDYSKEEIRDFVIETLEVQQAGGVGYFFAGDYEGNTVMGPMKGQNSYDIQTDDGTYLVREIINLSKNGGGFYEYDLPTEANSEGGRKISYIVPVEEFKFYLGLGVMLDELDTMKEEIRDDYYFGLKVRGLMFVFSLLASFFIMSLLNNGVYKKITREVELLSFYLRKAKTKEIDIMETFEIEEFQIISDDLSNLLIEKTKYENSIKTKALIDDITGLPNRNYFYKRLHEIKNLKNDSFGAVIFIDIDNFKLINDNFGHSFGDDVIRMVGDKLVESIDGFVTRFGGDEFAIILHPLNDKEDVNYIMRDLFSDFKTELILNSQSIRITLSAGVEIFNSLNLNIEEVIRNADLAMYKSKESGRNRYSIFEQVLLDGNNKAFDIDLGLKKAIENDEFILNFQPIYSGVDYSIKGFESLIRWDSPEFGMVYPDQFIGIAEKSGLISEITKIVIDKACRFLVDINSNTVTASINVSVQDILHTDFEKWLDDTTDKYEISKDRIIIEITETVLIQNIDEVIDKLKRMKSFGYKFALDDFGTGYSSLSYIINLPIDIIKIDRGFVMNEDDKSKQMVAMITELSKMLNLEVIAEGVESKEQAIYLKELGVHRVQGYYFNKPLAEDIAKKELKKPL